MARARALVCMVYLAIAWAILVVLGLPICAAEATWQGSGWQAHLTAPDTMQFGESTKLVLQVASTNSALRLAATIPGSSGAQYGTPKAPGTGNANIWDIDAGAQVTAEIGWTPAMQGQATAVVDLWLARNRAATNWEYVGRRTLAVWVFSPRALKLGWIRWGLPNSSVAESVLSSVASALRWGDVAVQLIGTPLVADIVESLDAVWVDFSGEAPGAMSLSPDELALAAGFVAKGGSLLATCNGGGGSGECNRLLAAVGASVRVSSNDAIGRGDSQETTVYVATSELTSDLATVKLQNATSLAMPARRPGVILQSTPLAVSGGGSVYGTLEKVGKGQVAVVGGSLIPANDTAESNTAFVVSLLSWLAEQAAQISSR